MAGVAYANEYGTLLFYLFSHIFHIFFSYFLRTVHNIGGIEGHGLFISLLSDSFIRLLSSISNQSDLTYKRVRGVLHLLPLRTRVSSRPTHRCSLCHSLFSFSSFSIPSVHLPSSRTLLFTAGQQVSLFFFFCLSAPSDHLLFLPVPPWQMVAGATCPSTSPCHITMLVVNR